MTYIKTGPTGTAQWHELILEAQSSAGIYLPEKIEHYVVMTLHANTKNLILTSAVIAIDFLKALEDNSKGNLQKLRDVGDYCLILSGLFPHRAIRKNVGPKYFENMGKEAYFKLSYAPIKWQFDQELFYGLFKNFSQLSTVLNEIRENPSISINLSSQ